MEQFVVTLLGSALGLESQDVQEPGVFKQCDKLLALVTSGKLFKDATIARKTFGTGCLCVESVPFAIATFLRHPTDFRAGVLEAVNAGGDTDSTASMVGAMIGANVGLAGIPEDWQIGPEREDALRLGVALHALVRKQ